MRTIYTLLLHLLVPFVLLRLLLRSVSAPAYRRRIKERFGSLPAGSHTAGVWVHAVSVGEVQAIVPLVHALLHAHPQLPIHITTTTPTGAATVSRLLAGQVSHSYVPYDLPWCVAAFLRQLRPQVLLMVETEIWPNLLHLCRHHGVVTLLANGRLSARSLRRYQHVAGFARTVFGGIAHVAAQTAEDAQRFQQLGVPASAVQVTGSIKFDLTIPASVEAQVHVMRRNWGSRPVWVAASTHEGEDEVMLAAHALLLQYLPDALLVLVPRHPERFERVAALGIKQGMTLVRRSSGDMPEQDTQVYLGDSMGELTVLMGASDAVFVGGSLVNVGGHNMLEASAQGVPVCFGPHTFNFSRIASMLIAAGAAKRVTDAAQLADLMSHWLRDASVRSRVGEAGRQVVQNNRGALQRLLEMMDTILATGR